MTHIKTLTSATLKQTAAHGGCGECQTSCQSACKLLAPLQTRSASRASNFEESSCGACRMVRLAVLCQMTRTFPKSFFR